MGALMLSGRKEGEHKEQPVTRDKCKDKWAEETCLKGWGLSFICEHFLMLLIGLGRRSIPFVKQSSELSNLAWTCS